VARLHHAMSTTPVAANRTAALLSKMFSLAEAWKYRPKGSNPVRGLERYRERARERFLSSEELGQLGDTLAAAEAGSAAGLCFCSASSRSPRSFSLPVTRAWQDTDCDRHQHYREHAEHTMCDRSKACSKPGSWPDGQRLVGMMSCPRLVRPWAWSWQARGQAQATRWAGGSHVLRTRPRTSASILQEEQRAWRGARLSAHRAAPRTLRGPWRSWDFFCDGDAKFSELSPTYRCVVPMRSPPPEPKRKLSVYTRDFPSRISPAPGVSIDTTAVRFTRTRMLLLPRSTGTRKKNGSLGWPRWARPTSFSPSSK
jgi:hypothetical protein